MAGTGSGGSGAAGFAWRLGMEEKLTMTPISIKSTYIFIACTPGLALVRHAKKRCGGLTIGYLSARQALPMWIR